MILLLSFIFYLFLSLHSVINNSSCSCSNFWFFQKFVNSVLCACFFFFCSFDILMFSFFSQFFLSLYVFLYIYLSFPLPFILILFTPSDNLFASSSLLSLPSLLPSFFFLTVYCLFHLYALTRYFFNNLKRIS